MTLLFSYALSPENLMKVRIGMLRVHAKGRGFSYDLFTFRAIPDAQRKNKQFKRKETPFFMPRITKDYKF